jgi:chaperonin GroEL
LTTELCCTAQKLLNLGIDINILWDGFKKAKEFVLEELKKYKHSISNENDIYNIAKISANNDEEIAKVIAEAFNKIGDNGIVSIADSLSRVGETSVKISSGIEFDRGFLSSISVNSSNDQAIFEEPAIILSSKVVNDVEKFTILLQNLIIKRIPIVIIAPDFDDEFLAWFREQMSKKTISGALILAPGVSKESINTNLIDFSIMMGGKIAYQDADLEDFDITKDICSCERIIITKGKTTVIAPEIDQERFDKHIENLQAKVTASSSEYAYSEYEIETIKERIARMTGGVATILVGALTTPELGEKKDRYEDAVNAVRATITDGYVIGAGSPLLKISYLMPKENYSLPVIAAIKEYLKAIRKPAKLLIESASDDPESIIPEILKNTINFGYNAKTEKVEDLLESGIIDPYKVVVNSLIYATNVAEAFMKIDAAIISDVPNLTIEPIDSILQDTGILGL